LAYSQKNVFGGGPIGSDQSRIEEVGNSISFPFLLDNFIHQQMVEN